MPRARKPQDELDLIQTKLGIIERLVTFIGSNFFKAVQTIIVLLLGILVWGVYKQVDQGKTFEEIIPFIKPTPEAETKNFHLSIAKNVRVHEALEYARDEVKSDRIILAEFHNNKRNLSLVPWNFTTARDVAIAPGISFDLKESESIPNTVNAEYYAEIWENPKEPRCIHKPIGEITSSYAKSRLAARGTTVFVMCPIQNHDSTPIGVVTAEYVRSPSTDAQVVIPVLRNLATELAPILGRE